MSVDPHTLLQTVFEAVHSVAYNLGKAVMALTQRDSYLYWPYLVSAGLLALAVAVVTARRTHREESGSWRRVFREYLSAQVWWSPSARADYALYLANALALPLVFGVLMFADTHVVMLINSALGKPLLPVGNSLEPAGVALRVAFTLVVFVAYDFGRFVSHCLLHDVPALWEFHKVNHSAETLNPITAFRAHPVDLLVMAWIPAIMTGLAAWSFNQVTDARITVYTYLGLHIILVASNFVGTLRHTNVWLSYGPFWNQWLVSPAQHQLHHSCEAHHIGCNRGFELAVWDRLYGTLYVPARQETFRMGLGDGTDRQWHNVGRMYWWPFRNAGRRMMNLRRRPMQPPPSQRSS